MKQRLFSVRWAASIVLASLSLFILPSQRFVQAAPVNNQISGPSVAPLLLPGTNASVDYYYSCYGACTFYTDEAKNAGQNDTPVWHVNSGSKNGWGGETYIGMKSPFDMVSFKMSTWGGSPDTPTYEYLQKVENGKEIWAQIPTLSTVGNHFRTPTADKIAKVSFAIPSDWQMSKFNSTDAYWIRMKATNATVIPKADYISARVYNVKAKLFVHEKLGGAGSKNPIFNNVPLTSMQSDYCPGALLNEYNAGAAMHYYAVRTDGAKCTLLFKLKNGYEGYAGQFATGNFTTTLTDLGEIELFPRLRVTIADADGKALPDTATTQVTLNGQPPVFVDPTSEYAPGKKNYYFAPAVVNATNVIKVSRVGYLDQPDVSFLNSVNTQLANISLFPYLETVNVHISGASACQYTSGKPSGNPIYCQGLKKNGLIRVYEKKGAEVKPVVGAKVEVFKDQDLTQPADDVTKDGVDDAVAVTGDDGSVSFGFSSGLYYVRVGKEGYTHSFGKLLTQTGRSSVQMKPVNPLTTGFDYVFQRYVDPMSPGKVYVYKDVSVEAKDQKLDDFYMPTVNADDGSYLYVGLASPFDRIQYQVSRWSNGNASYEYAAPNDADIQLGGPIVYKKLKLATENGAAGSDGLNKQAEIGLAEAHFPIPADWVKSKVNGVEAYWIRAKIVGIAPNLDRVSTMYPYNAKVQFRKAEKSVQGAVVYSLYNGKVYVSSPSDYMLPCEINRELKLPDGIHLYSVKFQSKQVYGNETCQLSFRLSPSMPDTSGFTYAVRDLMGSSVPGFYDLTTDDKSVYFSYRVAVRVEDEMGNKLTNAKVTYNNKPPLGQLDGQGMVGTYVFTPKNLNVPRAVRVVANGYVTEDGQTSHAGLKQVAPGSKKETLVYFSGTDNHECDQPIKDGAAAVCGRLRRDLTVRVTHKGAPVEQADVKIYTSAAKNKLANDLSKNLFGFADKDAQGKTDANGLSKAAMATGQYWIQASKAGFKSKTVVAKVTTGIANTVIIELEESAETPTCLSPLGLQIPCVPPPTTGDCLDTSKPCTPTSTIPTECRNALGQIVPCVPPTTGDCLDTSKPCTPTSTIPTICRNALGQIVPCPGSVPQICKDTAGNVIPCPGTVPKVCKDTAGNAIPCPTDSTPKLSSIEVGVVGTSTLTTGQSVPLFAYAHFTDGSKKDIGFECAWSMSNNTLGLIQNVKFISLSGIGIDVVTCTYAKDGIQKSGDLPITIQLDPSLQPTTGGTSGGTSGGGRTAPSTH